MSDDTVTVRANAEILDGWERDSVHTVARTKFVDAMIRERYVTEVEAEPDAEPELIGAAAEANMTVQVAAVPRDDAGVDEWRRFLTGQGIPYSVDQAEDAGALQALWTEQAST